MEDQLKAILELVHEVIISKEMNLIVEDFTTLFKKFYDSFGEKGFSKEESMQLLLQTIRSLIKCFIHIYEHEERIRYDSGKTEM